MRNLTFVILFHAIVEKEDGRKGKERREKGKKSARGNFRKSEKGIDKEEKMWYNKRVKEPERNLPVWRNSQTPGT